MHKNQVYYLDVIKDNFAILCFSIVNKIYISWAYASKKKFLKGGKFCFQPYHVANSSQRSALVQRTGLSLCIQPSLQKENFKKGRFRWNYWTLNCKKFCKKIVWSAVSYSFCIEGGNFWPAPKGIPANDCGEFKRRRCLYDVPDLYRIWMGRALPALCNHTAYGQPKAVLWILHRSAKTSAPVPARLLYRHSEYSVVSQSRRCYLEIAGSDNYHSLHRR